MKKTQTEILQDTQASLLQKHWLVLRAKGSSVRRAVFNHALHLNPKIQGTFFPYDTIWPFQFLDFRQQKLWQRLPCIFNMTTQKASALFLLVTLSLCSVTWSARIPMPGCPSLFQGRGQRFLSLCTVWSCASQLLTSEK